MTLDETLLTSPRLPNGNLPWIQFARLTNTSTCINAGTNRGFAFYGTAPDLGAFESGPTNTPNPTIRRSGGNMILATKGWANQTNYFWAATNLSDALWTCVTTNKSTLSGDCAFTNTRSSFPQRFYRVSSP